MMRRSFNIHIEGDFNATGYERLFQETHKICSGIIEMNWNFSNDKGIIEITSENCQLSILSNVKFLDTVTMVLNIRLSITD